MSRLRRQAAVVGAVTLLTGISPHHGTRAFVGVRAEQDTAGAAFSIASGGPIQTLTRPTFISSVLESSGPALVWFYDGTDCPQCESLLPSVETAAGKLASWGVSVASVDVSKESKLRRDLSIPKGLPSMIKVYHSETTPNPYGGLALRSSEIMPIFQDARTLQKKVLTAIPDSVISVDLVDPEQGSPSSSVSRSLQEALVEGGSDKNFAAVLFTEAGKASPVLRVMASQLNGRVTAVQARLPKKSQEADAEDEDEAGDESGALTEMLKGVIDVQGQIPSVPCLVVVDKSSGKGYPFGGAVDDAKAMLDFIRDGAGITPEPSASDNDVGDSNNNNGDGGGQDKKDKNQAERGGLLRLDPGMLATLVEEGFEALVVAFVEGGDVDSVPGWGEATKSLQGQIRAGVMDCSAHPDQCQGSSKNKAPHLKVYPHGRGVDGDRRAFPSEFPASEVKEAVAEAEASLPELVTVIPSGADGQRTLDNVQGFIGTSLLADGAPMCLLVLSRREEPNLVVKTIAAEFQSAKIRTVFVSNPSDAVFASFGVFKLPAMVLIFQQPDGMEVGDIDPSRPKPGPGETAMVTAHYAPGRWGPVTHEHVSAFILYSLSSVDRDALLVHVQEMSRTAKLNAEKLPPQLQAFLAEFGESEDSEHMPSPGGPGDSNISAAPFRGVSELTPEIWESITGAGEGGGHPHTAVGVFLLDRFSEGFAAALKAAESAAEVAAGRLSNLAGGIDFVWADAPCQEGFARGLGLSDVSEVPVLVAFSPKHQKSARFVGAWEADSLGTFLGKALGGRAPLFPIGDEPPRLDEGVDCSQRQAPEWLSNGGGDGTGDAKDDDIEDFMAEILAEEAKAKRELEEEVARGLQEMKDAEESAAAPPKRTKKTVKKRKKKSKSARSEL